MRTNVNIGKTAVYHLLVFKRIYNRLVLTSRYSLSCANPMRFSPSKSFNSALVGNFFKRRSWQIPNCYCDCEYSVPITSFKKAFSETWDVLIALHSVRDRVPQVTICPFPTVAVSAKFASCRKSATSQYFNIVLYGLTVIGVSEK